MHAQPIVGAIIATAVLIAAAGHAEGQATTRPQAESLPWRVIHEKEFSIAVPSDWSSLGFLPRGHVLHLTGDGRGLPHLDETGAPLQTGLSIERFPGVHQTPDEGSKTMLDNLRADPNMEIIGEPKTEIVELSDGTRAVVQTSEFFRTDKGRRSYHVKLIAEDSNKVGWIVSAWMVGGKESAMNARKVRHVQRLRAHLLSFCFDGDQFTDEGVRAAYEGPRRDAKRQDDRPFWRRVAWAIAAGVAILLAALGVRRHMRSRRQSGANSN